MEKPIEQTLSDLTADLVVAVQYTEILAMRLKKQNERHEKAMKAGCRRKLS